MLLKGPVEGGGRVAKVVGWSFLSTVVWVLVIGIGVTEGIRSIQQASQDPPASTGDAATDESATQPLIAGGQNAPKGRYPYICSLRTNGHIHRCGGVLVNESWVVTAAHCVDPDFPHALGLNPVVYVGGWDIEQDETSGEGIEVVRPLRTVIHPLWNSSILHGYDIALLQLPQPSNHSPVALIPEENVIHTGQLLVGIGWGLNENGKLPRYLQQATDLEFISSKNCKKIQPRSFFPPGVVCALTSQQDTCEGDSGGPLLLADSREGNVNKGKPTLDLLVGITSTGPSPCRSGEHPSFSTNVGYFSAWMESVWNSGDAVRSEEPHASGVVPVAESTMVMEQPGDDNSAPEGPVAEGGKEVPAPIFQGTTEPGAAPPVPIPADVGVQPQAPEPDDSVREAAKREDIKFVTLHSAGPAGSDGGVPVSSAPSTQHSSPFSSAGDEPSPVDSPPSPIPTMSFTFTTTTSVPDSEDTSSGPYPATVWVPATSPSRGFNAGIVWVPAPSPSSGQYTGPPWEPAQSPYASPSNDAGHSSTPQSTLSLWTVWDG